MDVEGVFIEMRTPDLDANDVVKLTFVVPGADPCECTVMAGVVRVSVEGAGLMLIDHEHKALGIIRAAERSA
jgi:hypothetical protein